MAERLQKILAQAAYGSRRACEVLISSGRVRVNGKIASLGQSADSAVDVITLDGTRIASPEQHVFVALYKPRNVISSTDDPIGRRTVRDLVPIAARLYPVGRLDWDSEGLTILTNDGDLANKLTHPRYGHSKEYRVLLARRPDPAHLATWRRGVVLADGYRTAPAQVEFEATAGKGSWIRVTMGEGRKRQIREIGSLLGLPIVRIVRVRIGPLRIGKLKPGEWRYLTDSEIQLLRGAPGSAEAGAAKTSTRPRQSSVGRTGARRSRRSA